VSAGRAIGIVIASVVALTGLGLILGGGGVLIAERVLSDDSGFVALRPATIEAAGSAFVVPAEILVGDGLSTGAALDDQQLQSLRTRSELVLARTRALSLLSRAAQTRRGLARKLEARGFSPPAVRAAVARMVELGYLDDRAFALDWARARSAARAEGLKAVYRGLIRHGVPRPIAAEAADEVCSAEAELEVARRLAVGLSPRAAANRLSARGFRSRTIARVLRELAGRRSAPE